MFRGLVCLFFVCAMSLTHMDFDTSEEYHALDYSVSSDIDVMYSTYYEDNDSDADSNHLPSDVEESAHIICESESLLREENYLNASNDVAANANE